MAGFVKAFFKTMQITQIPGFASVLTHLNRKAQYQAARKTDLNGPFPVEIACSFVHVFTQLKMYFFVIASLSII